MSWDDEAAAWDDNPAVQAYSRAALRSLRALLAERGARLEGARVLDFGCGTGLLTAAMAREAEWVVGLDRSRPMIDVLAAKQVPNLIAVAGGLDDLDTTGLDLITCSSVCAFLTDYPGTVLQLVGRLRPGGLFVQWDWELDRDAEEPTGLSRDAIAAALRGAGLTDVEVRTGFEEPFEEMTMAPLLGVGRKPTP